MKIFSIENVLNRLIIYIFGIKISFRFRKTIFIKNYFKTKFQKNALLVYIIDPFLGNHYYCHSNATESYTAAQILSELGYNVDILDWTKTKPKEFYSKYDVVYGLVENEALFSGAKVINYFAGTPHKDLNKSSILRAYEFYKKTGLDPTKSLWLHENFRLAFSHANIFLGNEVVADSFKIDGIEQRLFPIDGFYFDVYDINLDEKDFTQAKNHFLWWGSTAAIHKGLDRVLDVFKQRKDLTLHICGFKNELETEFLKYYKKELNNEIPNIINHGFVDIKGDLFKEIMNTCAAVVSPSISEGGAIGIINVIANGGLIPIISKSSGLNVGQYGFMFEKLDAVTVNSMIDKFLNLNPNYIKKLSQQVKTETREKYSFENYKNNLTKILKEILED